MLISLTVIATDEAQTPGGLHVAFAVRSGLNTELCSGAWRVGWQLKTAERGHLKSPTGPHAPEDGCGGSELPTGLVMTASWDRA